VRIENLLYTLRSIKPIAKYDLSDEPYIFEDAYTNALRWIKRYEKEPRGDWAQKQDIEIKEDKYNKVVGLMGEEIFECILDQLDISHKRARPKYPRTDPRGGKPYDFFINGFGSIEVKTVAPFKNYIKLMIDIKSYMGCDYVVGIKLYYENGYLMSKKEVAEKEWDYTLLETIKSAVLVGWLTKEEVENLHIDDLRRGPFYWTYLDPSEARREGIKELNKMNKFFFMLIK